MDSGRSDELIRGLVWLSWLQKNDTCQQGRHSAPLIPAWGGTWLPLCIVPAVGVPLWYPPWLNRLWEVLEEAQLSGKWVRLGPRLEAGLWWVSSRATVPMGLPVLQGLTLLLPFPGSPRVARQHRSLPVAQLWGAPEGPSSGLPQTALGLVLLRPLEDPVSPLLPDFAAGAWCGVRGAHSPGGLAPCPPLALTSTMLYPPLLAGPHHLPVHRSWPGAADLVLWGALLLWVPCRGQRAPLELLGAAVRQSKDPIG